MSFVYFVGVFDSINNSQEFPAMKIELTAVVISLNSSSLLKDKLTTKYKILITNKMHKENFIIDCNTLLHVSTLLGHLQGETFSYRYTRVALYS
jgi:hypothetical protein